MGAVIPFIPTIASTIGGIIGGKKATSSAMKRSPEEQVSLKGGQAAAGSLTGMGAGLYGTGTGMIGQGRGTLAQPTNYYQKLLGGNRALASQAVAAPRAEISDVYRGATRSLEQSGVRGAQRDVAKTDLSRQRAGQISSLITGVQPSAAEMLTGIGQTGISQGAGIASTGTMATGTGGGIYSGLLSQGANNRAYARGEGQQFGQSFGSMIFDILKGTGKFNKKGAGGGNFFSSAFPVSSFMGG